jgi:glc operon protein GlcG
MPAPVPYMAETKYLTNAGAKKMAAVAIEHAQKQGIALVVAIVDAGGHILLIERMDGGRFHSVHSALAKAVCAASNRRATGPRGAQGQALDTVHALGLALAAGPERFTSMEGGFPVLIDEHCIGGIGVAGGTFEFDEQVARNAVRAIGARVE